MTTRVCPIAATFRRMELPRPLNPPTLLLQRANLMKTCKLVQLSCLLFATTMLAQCWQSMARACPFCSATSQTLSEELAGAEVAVIARLVKPVPELNSDSDAPTGFDPLDPNTGKAIFAIVDVLRGSEKLGETREIQVVYFGPAKGEKHFLISGLSNEPVDWTTPLPLTERGEDYVRKLGTLPEKGPERLPFFLDHLEDSDPLLAQDAYDEFARSPYEDVIAIAEKMDRGQLTHWIGDTDVGPTRRRLYLTMLGVCGEAEDIALLESLLKYDYQLMKPGIAAMVSTMGLNGPAWGVSLVEELVRADVRRKRQCLDALVAAYLKLKGPTGLPLIERLFLNNPAAEYTHVYATIMALRFHGEETDVIPRERLLESMRLVLNNSEIADQVIPDLTRWEDWSILDRLVSMFKTSQEDDWVRQPVISYVLTAVEQPGEVGVSASQALAELEVIDPKGVKRARSYLAFGLPSRSKAAESNTESNADQTASEQATDQSAPVATATDQEPVEAAATAATSPSIKNITAEKKPEEAIPAPNHVMIVGIPLIAGVFLLGIFALLLRGTDIRSPGGSSPAPPAN